MIELFNPEPQATASGDAVACGSELNKAYDGIDWNGYSYAWNADQRDAELVPAAGRELELADYGNFRTAVTPAWRIHSRSECQRCHNHWIGGPLAFLPPQLNRVVATWIAQTKDGKVHSGILINRDEQKIVIRNAKAEDTILNANDIEELQPQAISLMPEKQLNDLSDADIADLLEFLSQQKSLPTQ